LRQIAAPIVERRRVTYPLEYLGEDEGAGRVVIRHGTGATCRRWVARDNESRVAARFGLQRPPFKL
jgi:hypothetical protein